MTDHERDARKELATLLRHWRTPEPGDRVTESHVVDAIAGLVYAMIERERDDNEAREHAR